MGHAQAAAPRAEDDPAEDHKHGGCQRCSGCEAVVVSFGFASREGGGGLKFPLCCQLDCNLPLGSNKLKDDQSQQVMNARETLADNATPGVEIVYADLDPKLPVDIFGNICKALEISTSDPNYREIDCEEGLYAGQVDVQTGLFHGLGRLKSPDTTAEGEWRAGKLHGQGMQTWQDGRRYVGSFAAGDFSGRGRMEWQHPRGTMVYEGEYLDDRKHGEGKFVWPSGKTYEGQWVSGRREGIGVDTSAGGVRCRGVWSDNVFVRALDDNAAFT